MVQKKSILSFVMMIFIGLGGVWFFLGRPITLPSVPIVVAVIDTGIKIGTFGAEKGWNFFDQTPDVSDEDGHGTAVAEMIFTHASDSKSRDFGFNLLPIKISRHGAGIRPSDLAAAIDYAVNHGAKLINLSSGLTQGSDALHAAVVRAHERGVILLTAAGTGVPNPFRPGRVEEIFPQAYPEVIVVGSVGPQGEPDLSMNYGSLIDFVVRPEPNKNDGSLKQIGSSFAVAAATGDLTRYLLSHPQVLRSSKPDELRAWLRASSRLPGSRVGSQTGLDRMGFGIFDSKPFFIEEHDHFSIQTVKLSEIPEKMIFYMSTAEEIISIESKVICAGETKVSAPALSGALKKGLAQFQLDPIPAKGCRVQLKISHPSGQEEMAL